MTKHKGYFKICLNKIRQKELKFMNRITKETIKKQALALFQERGYNHVTIMDICGACQITKPTFYKYAGSKEELVLDLYDTTICDILKNPYVFVDADTHYEQLLIVFHHLIKESEKFGSDLFSQMLISNLKENHHSFDMRDDMTRLCTLIIEKAQNTGEIENKNEPGILYLALAHSFMGFETNWCIYNGRTNWGEQFFLGMNAMLNVKENLKELYKKYA